MEMLKENVQQMSNVSSNKSNRADKTEQDQALSEAHKKITAKTKENQNLRQKLIEMEKNHLDNLQILQSQTDALDSQIIHLNFEYAAKNAQAN